MRFNPDVWAWQNPIQVVGSRNESWGVVRCVLGSTFIKCTIIKHWHSQTECTVTVHHSTEQMFLEWSFSLWKEATGTSSIILKHCNLHDFSILSTELFELFLNSSQMQNNNSPTVPYLSLEHLTPQWRERTLTSDLCSFGSTLVIFWGLWPLYIQVEH